MSTKAFGKKGWASERIGNISGKTYLITGANTGAGFEAAKILLGKGGKVVMLNRNEEKSREAVGDLHGQFGADAKVSFIKMDLASLASVRDAAGEVTKSVPIIDALICNAAIAQVAQREFTTDGFESQLGINHYGHFLLINLLFDRVEASKGRIVVVGSEGYKMGLRTIQTPGFWQLGKTEMARAFIWPTLIAGVLLLLIGTGLTFTNRSCMASFPEAYANDANTFVTEEIARAEQTMQEYQTIVFKVILLIITVASVLLLFVNTPVWWAIGITTIAMMVVILFVDSNANARMEHYYEQLSLYIGGN
ncbi:MAG: SDR family NAD(P)-dependent oxidoreductase [Bacteroidota bacterium]